MYSKKSVRRRTEPWRTQALIRNVCEDFPCRTTRNRLLIRKEEIRLNIWTEIPWDLSYWIIPKCQTLSKTFYISNVAARWAPDLLKALAVLSNTTVVVDREDWKLYWKNIFKYIYFFFVVFSFCLFYLFSFLIYNMFSIIALCLLIKKKKKNFKLK